MYNSSCCLVTRAAYYNFAFFLYIFFVSTAEVQSYKCSVSWSWTQNLRHRCEICSLKSTSSVQVESNRGLWQRNGDIGGVEPRLSELKSEFCWKCEPRRLKYSIRPLRSHRTEPNTCSSTPPAHRYIFYCFIRTRKSCAHYSYWTLAVFVLSLLARFACTPEEL
jgi:hypothetical protein